MMLCTQHACGCCLIERLANAPCNGPCCPAGDKLVAAAAGGALWSAAVDLRNRSLPGVTATQLAAAGSRDWSAVAISGSTILAAADGDYLYASTDGGSSFRQLTIADTRAGWAGVAIVVSGGLTFQFAAVRNGDILCTANNWASYFTWIALGSRNWTSIAAASTGAVRRGGR